MRILGISHDIELWAPKDAYLSFYNSPYIGHKKASAVDIYPSHSDWNGDAFSPVDGRVEVIRAVQMGKGRDFPSSEVDYGLGIIPDGYSDRIVRILHCRPCVDIGDIIDRGDSIGQLLRSRYFHYWTGPHYHVEVLRPDTFHRSTQSYSLTPNVSELEKAEIKPNTSEFFVEVNQVSEDFVIGYSDSIPYGSTHDLVGHLGISISNVAIGILDAGVPHYSVGGIHNPNYNDGEIVFCGNVIGQTENSGMFRINKRWTPHLNGRPLRGISLFIYPHGITSKGRPPIWLIPQRRGDLTGVYSKGDIATLTTSENSYR